MALQFNRRFHISVDDADITTNNQNNVSKFINQISFPNGLFWTFFSSLLVFSTFDLFFPKTFICMEKTLNFVFCGLFSGGNQIKLNFGNCWN